jgi:hypothetical protein
VKKVGMVESQGVLSGTLFSNPSQVSALSRSSEFFEGKLLISFRLEEVELGILINVEVKR